MIKIVISLLLGFFSLNALEWHSYDEALELQKQNSKLIMIDVVRADCQYCIRMDKNVFKNKEMSKWLNERFIPVKINLDIDKMPLDVVVSMTPTFYFIDKNIKIIKIIHGSWNIEDFKDLTQNIKGIK